MSPISNTQKPRVAGGSGWYKERVRYRPRKFWLLRRVSSRTMPGEEGGCVDADPSHQMGMGL